MNIFYYITNFSPDIINIVVSYLSKEEYNRLEFIKPMVSKKIYSIYPGVERISRHNFDNYLRWIIRNDNYFLFEFSMKIVKIIKKKISFKNKKFKTYIEYIKYLIQYYNSSNCNVIISNVK